MGPTGQGRDPAEMEELGGLAAVPVSLPLAMRTQVPCGAFLQLLPAPRWLFAPSPIAGELPAARRPVISSQPSAGEGLWRCPAWRTCWELFGALGGSTLLQLSSPKGGPVSPFPAVRMGWGSFSDHWNAAGSGVTHSQPPARAAGGNGQSWGFSAAPVSPHGSLGGSTQLLRFY